MTKLMDQNADARIQSFNKHHIIRVSFKIFARPSTPTARSSFYADIRFILIILMLWTRRLAM
jgi:hypothetical protein